MSVKNTKRKKKRTSDTMESCKETETLLKWQAEVGKLEPSKLCRSNSLPYNILHPKTVRCVGRYLSHARKERGEMDDSTASSTEDRPLKPSRARSRDHQ